MSSQFSGGDGVVVSSPYECPEYPDPQKTTLNLQEASGVTVLLCAVVLAALLLLDAEGVVVDVLFVLGVDEFPDG